MAYSVVWVSKSMTKSICWAYLRAIISHSIKGDIQYLIGFCDDASVITFLHCSSAKIACNLWNECVTRKRIFWVLYVAWSFLYRHRTCQLVKYSCCLRRYLLQYLYKSLQWHIDAVRTLFRSAKYVKNLWASAWHNHLHIINGSMTPAPDCENTRVNLHPQ